MAQLVRASPCHGEGRRFESDLGRFTKSEKESVTDSLGISHGILAQLGEHLPYKQRVIGSSPIGPINQFYIDYAGVAELSDAQDLKSCGTNLPYRFDSGRRHCLKVEETLINTAFPLFLHKGNDVLPWVEIPKPHLMLMTSV